MASYQECHRLRYLTYHYGGKGLQRTSLGLPLINGDFVHLALARLIQGEDLNDVLSNLKEKYEAAVTSRGLAGEVDIEFLINEQLCLLEGLVRAWVRVRLKEILSEFLVVDVEREMAWKMAPDVTVMLRLDAVLRRKRDGLLFIKDYKTLSAIYDSDWGKRFEHDSQLLCYSLAAEELYGEPIGGLLMEGLIKGKRAKDRSQTSPFLDQVIQQSPLCYAYESRDKNTHLPLYEKSWGKGTIKVPVWELKGGIEAWLTTEWSDLDLQDLFLVLPPIRPVRRDQERWRNQVTAQERNLVLDLAAVKRLHDEALEGSPNDTDYEERWEIYYASLDEYFPQNHNHCFRYFGHPCAMERLCFTEEIENDPFGSELYQTRVPHHSTEEEGGA